MGMKIFTHFSGGKIAFSFKSSEKETWSLKASHFVPTRDSPAADPRAHHSGNGTFLSPMWVSVSLCWP
jgi:hypothetical protein